MEADTVQLLGQSAAGGVIVMFVMSLLKDIGRPWPTQVKRIVALVLAGAASAIAVGTHEMFGWSTFESFEGWQMYIGVTALAYTTMQASYTGWFSGTRLEAGLAATGVRDPHDDPFEITVEEEHSPDI